MAVVVAVVLAVVGLVVACTTPGPRPTRPTHPARVAVQGARLARAITAHLTHDGLALPFTVTCPSTPVAIGSQVACTVTRQGQRATVWATIDATGFTAQAFRGGTGLYVVSAVEHDAAEQLTLPGSASVTVTVGPCTRSGSFVSSVTDGEIMRCDVTQAGAATQKNGVAIEAVPGVPFPGGWVVVVASQGDAMQRTRVTTAQIKAAAPASAVSGPLDDASAAARQLVQLATTFSTPQVNGFGIPLAWASAQPTWPAVLTHQPAGAGIAYLETQVTAGHAGATNYAFSFAVRDTSGRCVGAVLEGSPSPHDVVVPPTPLTTCTPQAAFARSKLTASHPT